MEKSILYINDDIVYFKDLNHCKNLSFIIPNTTKQKENWNCLKYYIENQNIIKKKMILIDNFYIKTNINTILNLLENIGYTKVEVIKLENIIQIRNTCFLIKNNEYYEVYLSFKGNIIFSLINQRILNINSFIEEIYKIYRINNYYIYGKKEKKETNNKYKIYYINDISQYIFKLLEEKENQVKCKKII